MNQISIFDKQELKISSREVAELCGKRHDNVIVDIEKLNEVYEQLGNLKIQLSQYFNELSGRSYKEYLLTHEQCLDLVTGYRAEMRIKINRRWLELEKAAKQPALPQNYLEALEALVETEKAKQAAEQKAAIAGGALQRLGAAQGSISIRAAAKSLKHPEKALVGRLLAMGYLYRLNGRLAAAQPYTKNGWFEHKYGDSDGKAFVQVLVTPLGMMKLAQKLEIAV